VLTRLQWKGVINFTHAVNADLVTSFAISAGVRDPAGVWTPVQARPFLAYTQSIGGKVAAAELFNEPTMPSAGGAPPGYDANSFAKNIAAFRLFAKAAVPAMSIVGPGSVGEGGVMSSVMPLLSTEKMLEASPRPNYWAALLWRRLMGTTVLEAGNSEVGLHLYAHCLKEHPGGVALLAINTSGTQPRSINLPIGGELSSLTADKLESPSVKLNGQTLRLAANDELPALHGSPLKAGATTLPPASITFLSLTTANNPNCH
jgi:hypothetical protein